MYSSLSDVYNIHKDDIHTLFYHDVGKQVIKIKPTSCNDFSYYGEILIVDKVELFNIRGCDVGICTKDGIKKCGRCGNAFYCSKECQTRDWGSHKYVCGKREQRDSKYQRAVYLTRTEKYPLSIRSYLISGKYDKSDEYFDNWIQVDKVKDIDRLLFLLKEYHAKRVDERKEEIDEIMKVHKTFLGAGRYTGT